MKKYFLTAFLAVSANAADLTIYSQTFKLTNVSEAVKCFESDPNSRSYGAVFLTLSGSDRLAEALTENPEARFTTNSYNGVMGDINRRCSNLPELTDEDGNLLQEITLTASQYESGACNVILRENLHLNAYGKELYGYGHGEILPAAVENCDLGKIQKLIAKSGPDSETKLYADRKSEIVVVTSRPDENGMCEKRIVTRTKKNKKEGMILIPLSKIGCGPK